MKDDNLRTFDCIKFHSLLTFLVGLRKRGQLLSFLSTFHVSLKIYGAVLVWLVANFVMNDSTALRFGIFCAFWLLRVQSNWLQRYYELLQCNELSYVCSARRQMMWLGSTRPRTALHFASCFSHHYSHRESMPDYKTGSQLTLSWWRPFNLIWSTTSSTIYSFLGSIKEPKHGAEKGAGSQKSLLGRLEGAKEP